MEETIQPKETRSKVRWVLRTFLQHPTVHVRLSLQYLFGVADTLSLSRCLSLSLSRPFFFNLCVTLLLPCTRLDALAEAEWNSSSFEAARPFCDLVPSPFDALRSFFEFYTLDICAFVKRSFFRSSKFLL